MSVDKFLMRNDTIVGRSYTIFDSPIVKGSVIFIDEFDASKMTMENRLIQNNLDNLLDYLDSFERITKKLANMSEHPTDIYKMSESLKSKLESDVSDLPDYKKLKGSTKDVNSAHRA